MRFKKLELLGFKTFAEPTEFLFEPGVTAVVGPNGCGKSNVADSIKWVLGEQSARELRGGRMEDLIFNGSEGRSPLNVAEVSLTLDNSDKSLPLEFAEVAIARRLYRSGESEYLLNGVNVRLKDIQELLMGTGVGTSAYSLFEQGRIEQIISARPEERRVIFEEAAGITKFKSQKREALRRMDETEANLARVGDVIAEIRRQIQALERAVRRAKQYQEQFEALKGMELAAGLAEQAKLSAQGDAKKAALEELQGRIAGIESRLAGQESELEQERQRLAQADQDLAQAREIHLSVTHRQETVRERLEVTAERMAESRRQQAQMAEDLQRMEEQIRRLQEERDALAVLLAKADSDRAEKERRIAGLSDCLDQCARTIREAQALLSESENRLLEAAASQVRVKNELAKVQQETSRREARHHRLQMEAAKTAGERADSSAQLDRLEQARAGAQAELERADQERALRRDGMAAAQAAMAQVAERVGGLEREMTRIASQLELLKGLLAGHEGYSSGVKRLLTALDEGRLSREGVDGVLAELIQIGPSEAAAADAAFGPWAAAVVVESPEAAERCRNYLAESQAGRVLFLIRDRVTEQGTAPVPPISCEGAVPLMERVGITPHLEQLAALLLSETWIVPDRATAQHGLAHLKERQPALWRSARFVTPSGEMFSAAGALLGSVPAEEGLVVGRLSRLQSMEVAAAHLAGEVQQAQGQLCAADADHRACEEAFASADGLFQEKGRTLQGIQARIDSGREALEKLRREEGLLNDEEKQAAAELEEIRAQMTQLEQELAAKEEGLRALESRIEGARARIGQAAKEREEISVEAARLKAEAASFDQVLESRRASLQLLEQTLEGTSAQSRTIRSEQARLGQMESQWAGGRQEMEETLRGLAEEEAAARERVAQAEGRKQKALAAAQQQEREWLALSRQMEQLQGQLHQIQMEQAQIHFQREQISSRLSQLYQVNLEELPADSKAPASEEELPDLRQKIQELSQKLQRMGPVNLGSIDEERELTARHEQMATQQADLVKAKEDLHEAITRINRTTRAMFRETFEQIQKEFQVTFRQLFGGGEARLVLLDEEDLLESGIEIIARPPGKPVQAISLLSGGEKALTSIALLFAIFRIKPSPFCLMDEIDAALDEHNIGRFTGALKEFLKESQFIIITHNKKTITMADVMYGITMAESGVSKIVSVRMRENGNGNGNGHAGGNGNGSGSASEVLHQSPQRQPQ